MARSARDEYPWFHLAAICLRCLSGDHGACLGHPDGGEFTRGDKSKPCACAEHDHQGGRGFCTDWRYQERGHFVFCGRPAKGTTSVHSHAGGEVEVERCGIHLAGLRRAAEHEARWREAMDAQSARWDAERTNGRAAQDWAERLRRELGIDSTAAATADGPFVRVDPERLYGMIVEAVTEMNFAGIEHRFHGPEEAPPS